MDKISSGNGRRLQARKPRKDGFSEAKRQIVLDQLAGCANLTRAAAAAGITPETVNYHRRRDPVFRQQVVDAIEAAYAPLQAMAIDYAATGKGYEPGATPGAGAGGGAGAAIVSGGFKGQVANQMALKS